MNRTLTLASTLALVALMTFLPLVSAGGVHVGGHSSPERKNVAVPVQSTGPTLALGHNDDAPLVPGQWFKPRPQEAASADDNSIRFVCPPIEDSIYTAAGCPAYIFDPEDVMSQPVLVVDPASASLMGFHALHGGHGLAVLPGEQPPTQRSRDDAVHQPHTFYRSEDGAFVWDDHRYYSPWHCYPEKTAQPCPDDGDIYGEDNAAVLDAEGRLYLASLYAWRKSDGAQPEYKIATWKGERLNQAPAYDVNKRIFNTDQPGNVIDSIDLAYSYSTNKVVLVWREDATDGPVGQAMKSWINAAYSVPGTGARWMPLENSERIGPCRAISNAVAVKHEVFVACLPDASARPDSREQAVNYTGAYEIWSINTRNMTTSLSSVTSLTRGEDAVLLDTKEDHLLMVTAGIGPDNRPFVDLSFGEYAGQWYDVFGLGNQLMNTTEPAGGFERQEVRITALGYREDTSHIHMIYMERYRLNDDQAASGIREYYKAIGNVVVNGKNLEFLGKRVLDLNSLPRGDISPQFQGFGEGVYSDLKDSIVVWKDEKGMEHEYIAYGDYGTIRFAEVVEDNAVPGFGFPFVAPIPPVPLAVAGTNPALVAGMAGVLSTAMVVRMLAAKKKTTVEAPSL